MFVPKTEFKTGEPCVLPAGTVATVTHVVQPTRPEEQPVYLVQIGGQLNGYEEDQLKHPL